MRRLFIARGMARGANLDSPAERQTHCLTHCRGQCLTGMLTTADDRVMLDDSVVMLASPEREQLSPESDAKENQPPTARTRSRSERCAVCAADDGTQLLTCTVCHVRVHADCYLPADEFGSCSGAEPFTCQACAAGLPQAQRRCSLCDRSGGGVLLGTVEGEWAHGICALLMPGVLLAPESGRLVAHGVRAALVYAAANAELRQAAPKQVAADKPSARLAALASSPRGLSGPVYVALPCPKDARCSRPARHVGRCRLSGGGPPDAWRQAARAAAAAAAVPSAAAAVAAPSPSAAAVAAPSPSAAGVGDGAGAPSNGGASIPESDDEREVEVEVDVEMGDDVPVTAPAAGGGPPAAEDAPKVECSPAPPCEAAADACAEASVATEGGESAPRREVKREAKVNGVVLDVDAAASADGAAADPAAPASPAAPAASAAAAASAESCSVCGGSHGLVRCAASTGGVAACEAWLHPSCAYDGGLALGSCAHFGAELFYALCRAHSKACHVYRPSAPLHCLPTPPTAVTARAAAPEVAGAAAEDDDEPGAAAAAAAEGEPDAALGLRRPAPTCLSRDSRASKLAKLQKLTQADSSAEDADADADAWWWALRVDLVPPATEAALCGEGAVLRGADEREWRVVVGRIDGRLRWAPLAADGAVAKPSQLPPPLPATRPSGLPDRLTSRPRGNASYAMLDDEEVGFGSGGGYGGHGGYGGYGGYGSYGGHGDGDGDGPPERSSYDSRCDSELIYNAATDRYELSAIRVDLKLWPGAAAEGWKVSESYHDSRKTGSWYHIAPDGTKHRTRTAAVGATPAADELQYPRVKLVMSRGGAPA